MKMKSFACVAFLLFVVAPAFGAPTAPPIRTREQWGATAAHRTRGSNRPNEFVIHHTAGPGMFVEFCAWEVGGRGGGILVEEGDHLSYILCQSFTHTSSN